MSAEPERQPTNWVREGLGLIVLTGLLVLLVGIFGPVLRACDETQSWCQQHHPSSVAECMDQVNQ